MANVTVEFFGYAAELAGTRQLKVDLPSDATVRSSISVLATNCPALVGPVLQSDLSDLAAGYTFNMGGRHFVGDLDVLFTSETLLLLPAAAGGR